MATRLGENATRANVPGKSSNAGARKEPTEAPPCPSHLKNGAKKDPGNEWT